MTDTFATRYRLQDRLGGGGMGEVWAAQDLRLGRRVAVKFLRPGGERDLRRWEQRFEREAQLTARIGHPGVPAVFETGRREDATLYIVMELVAGRTLSALLKEKGPFPVPLAATVAFQAADVLAHAHRLHVIHRDLKPSNLMLAASGTLKVLDFGIAAALLLDPDEPRLTRTDEMLGTAGFISPEQARGEPVLPASDLYALGCVLYEITAGKPPFEAGRGASPLVLVLKHMNDEPLPVAGHRPGIPPAFAELIVRLLAKDPAERPSARKVQQTARACMAPDAPSADRAQGAPGSVRRAPAAAPAPGAAAADEPPHPLAPLAARVRTLTGQGEHDRAAALVEDHLRALGRALDDPGLVELRLTHCALLLAAEDFTTAYDGYFALGGALRRKRPKTDRDVLACRAGVARCLKELGRTPEALYEFETLLPVQRHVFGAVDRTVLDTRYEIAALTASGGRIEPARELLGALVDDQRRVLPAGDERHARAVALLVRLDRLLKPA